MLTEQHAQDMGVLCAAVAPQARDTKVVLRAYERLETMMKDCEDAIEARKEQQDTLYEAAVNARCVLLPQMRVMKSAVEAINEGRDYNFLQVGAAMVACIMAQGEMIGESDRPYRFPTK